MTPRQQLDELVDLFTPRLRDAFLAAIQDVADNTVLQVVIDAIIAGDPEAAFRALGFGDAAMRPLTAEIERAFETGGVMTGRTFPKYINTTNGKGVFRFDVRNSRAEAWLRDHSSQLVTRLTNEAMTNVRVTLQQGMIDGRNPRNVALDIVGRYDPVTKRRVGGIIGLTEQQEGWIRNTRRDLENLSENYFTRELRDKRSDSIVRRAIDEGKPLSAADVDRLVDRSTDLTLKYRAEVIARTEAMQSLNASEYEATLQAVDLGATKVSAVKREWDDTGDKRTRPSHRVMNGQRVGLYETFKSPSGVELRYPGDTSNPGNAPAKTVAAETIMCRCRVRNVIDWLADLD